MALINDALTRDPPPNRDNFWSMDTQIRWHELLGPFTMKCDTALGLGVPRIMVECWGNLLKTRQAISFTMCRNDLVLGREHASFHASRQLGVFSSMNLSAYLRQPFPLIHLARRRLKVNNHGMMRHDLLAMSTRFRLEFFFCPFFV